MLRLDHIVKTYQTGEFHQDALKDVSIRFRTNEFVAVLGASGSGKTTMLNLIGGLDRYTSGDIHIEGVSTKRYKDRDWDAYRNRSIGFVFQSYNLIPHQSVLANVELALTLAGVSRSERIERAKKALDQVGLMDHIHKRPNQLSGGQMQRVAIARALVNNPEILLADEPTGAIDSQTSLQIMNLLQDIARDRLVIMVTHNPDLAEAYATRIVKLQDGQIISDSNPYEADDTMDKSPSRHRVGMNFMTALSLSFNNLKTKRGRTILTAFAGSIGIIGIALILALSSGMQDYISRMEEDTLSSYPITLQTQGIELEAQGGFPMNDTKEDPEIDPFTIYQAGDAAETLKRRTFQMYQNDLASFKEYLESPESVAITQYTSAIQYGYPIQMDLYSEYDSRWIQLNPREETSGPPTPLDSVRQSVWTEMMDNPELLATQYDVLVGRWPQGKNELVLVVDENNQIRDITLYELGLKDRTVLEDMRTRISQNEDIETSEPERYAMDNILGKTYRILLPSDYYEETDSGWVERRDDESIRRALEKAHEMTIVGIIRPNPDAAAASITGNIAYTKDLTTDLITKTEESLIVQAQRNDPSHNVLTGEAFVEIDGLTDEELIDSMTDEEKLQVSLMNEPDKLAFLARYRQTRGVTYDQVLQTLGIIDASTPSSINLFLRDFDSRETVIMEIDRYNQERQAAGEEEQMIGYTDVVGLMTSSITDIIGIISYLLIGFVSISLVVSSIMIGIITYISVLERTKEIGILRSIGASKGDISRVFNAETTLIGLASGLLGIGISLLLIIPINRVIERLSGASEIAALPPEGAIGLIIISMVLTILAGLIPARMAAKRDPVIALRTE